MAKSLHTEVVNAIHYIRGRLGEKNIGYFEFNIKVEGRTESCRDNVKIEYHLNHNYDCRVKGDKLEAVVTELLRRKGWDDTHAPLAISDESEIEAE